VAWLAITRVFAGDSGGDVGYVFGGLVRPCVVSFWLLSASKECSPVRGS